MSTKKNKIWGEAQFDVASAALIGLIVIESGFDLYPKE